MPPTAGASMPPTSGCMPAMLNKNEDRSEGSCVSGTTAAVSEVSMSCTDAMTSDIGAAKVGIIAATFVTGATTLELGRPHQGPAPPH